MVTTDLKFRAILHFRGEKIMCSSSGVKGEEKSGGVDASGVKYGVMKFPLPIVRNYPGLKMNNTMYQNV